MHPNSATSLIVALYQPDIPQNTGTILRMCAYLGLPAAIIEPAGFSASDRHFRRAGMDYLAYVDIARYPHWEAFEDWRRANGRRLVLLTTKASRPYTAFRYLPGDILLAGRESAGVPEEVHDAADARLNHSFAAANEVAKHCRCLGHGGGGSGAANSPEGIFLNVKVWI
jgi:tRNA (cytidine/uridine-2'-O-)-methyltransferase